MELFMKNNQILLHDIGGLIRKLRKEKGMSGIDLGVELGISQQQVSRYENAKSVLTITTFINICIVFNITPTEFFHHLCDNNGEFFNRYISYNW